MDADTKTYIVCCLQKLAARCPAGTNGLLNTRAENVLAADATELQAEIRFILSHPECPNNIRSELDTLQRLCMSKSREDISNSESATCSQRQATGIPTAEGADHVASTATTAQR